MGSRFGLGVVLAGSIPLYAGHWALLPLTTVLSLPDLQENKKRLRVMIENKMYDLNRIVIVLPKDTFFVFNYCSRN